MLAGIEETYTHYGLDFEGVSMLTAAFCLKIAEAVAVEKGSLNAEEMNRFKLKACKREECSNESLWVVLRQFSPGWGLKVFSSLFIPWECLQVLADLDILDYFTEIVTTANGCKKPDPEGWIIWWKNISWIKKWLISVTNARCRCLPFNGVFNPSISVPTNNDQSKEINQLIK